MKKINFKREWKFIQTEVHKERPNKRNQFKRELLFILQVLLSNSADSNSVNDFRVFIYSKTKEKYINL